MKKTLALSLVACSVLGTFACAYEANNKFEITPQIGGSWHIGNDRYADDMDVTYGLKFANRVSRNVLVGVGFDRVASIDYTGKFPVYNNRNRVIGTRGESTHANRFYMDVVREFDINYSFSPYILGGFGYEYITNSRLSVDSDLYAQYGVGVRYPLTDFLHLKAEVKHLLNFDGRSDIVGTIGFTIPFGTYVDATEVAAAEAASQPSLSHIHTFSVKFPFDSSEIRPMYNAEIVDFAESMKQNPNQTAVIGGHTDSIGEAGYNQRLSERRANAVKNAIVNQGVEEGRIRAEGYGATRPVADNRTSEGRSQNRRVEAEIYINNAPNKNIA